MPAALPSRVCPSKSSPAPARRSVPTPELHLPAGVIWMNQPLMLLASKVPVAGRYMLIIECRNWQQNNHLTIRWGGGDSACDETIEVFGHRRNIVLRIPVTLAKGHVYFEVESDRRPKDPREHFLLIAGMRTLSAKPEADTLADGPRRGCLPRPPLRLGRGGWGGLGRFWAKAPSPVGHPGEGGLYGAMAALEDGNRSRPRQGLAPARAASFSASGNQSSSLERCGDPSMKIPLADHSYHKRRNRPISSSAKCWMAIGSIVSGTIRGRSAAARHGANMAGDYDRIIVWQVEQPVERLFDQGATNVVYVPMWDGADLLSTRADWRLAGARVLSFWGVVAPDRRVMPG